MKDIHTNFIIAQYIIESTLVLFIYPYLQHITLERRYASIYLLRKFLQLCHQIIILILRKRTAISPKCNWYILFIYHVENQNAFIKYRTYLSFKNAMTDTSTQIGTQTKLALQEFIAYLVIKLVRYLLQ